MRTVVVSALLVLLSACANTPTEQSADHEPHAPPPRTEKLEPYTCGAVQRLHTLDGVFLGSQPSAADLEQAKAGGITTLVDLRRPEEDRGFDEPAKAAEIGLAYVNLGYQAPDSLTDGLLDEARGLLRDRARRPIFLHCSSGNRVGAVWLAHRVLDAGLPWETALDEAKLVGLKLPAYEQRVRAYVDARRR